MKRIVLMTVGVFMGVSITTYKVTLAKEEVGQCYILATRSKRELIQRIGMEEYGRRIKMHRICIEGMGDNYNGCKLHKFL